MRTPVRALVLVLSGASAITFAGWRPAVSITGTPTDVMVSDAGVFAVSAAGVGPTNSAFQCDGGGNCGVFASGPNPAVGAWAPAAGCLSVVQGQQVRQTCPPAGVQVFPAAVGNATRSRSTSSGRVYVAMFNASAPPVAIWSSPTGGTVNDWAVFNYAGVGVTNGAALGAVRVGLDDYGVVAASTNTVAFKNGAALFAVDTVGTPSDLWLYDQSGKPAGVFIVGGNVLHIPDINNPALGRTSAPVPVAAGPTNTVAFDWNDGSNFGRGFGMLTGSSAMWGAIPANGAAGLSWIPRTGPGWPINELKRVSCFGAKFCVAIRASAVAPNVAWYFNDSPPVLVMVPSPTMNEGDVLPISATTFDSDGDPVYVNWTLGPLNGAALSVAPTAGDPTNGGLTITTTAAGTFCTPSVTVNATVTLSDGLAEHDTDAGTSVITVQRIRGPTPPTLPATFTLNSDGGQQALTATPPGSGCQPQSYQWTLTAAAMAAGIGLITDAGTTALLAPPIGFCAVDAGPYAVNVVGVDMVGASSLVSTNVQIVRTTPPEAPGVMPLNVVVNVDGGGVPFTASASMSGCPPQSYLWSLPGPVLATGISLVSDGGPTALVVPPLGFCGINAGPFTLGVAAVDTVGTSTPAGASFTLLRTTSPGTPIVSPLTATLGPPDASVPLTATAGFGCAPTSYGWSFTDPADSGVKLVFDGGPAAALVAPDAFCGVDGGSASATVLVTAIDDAGTSAAATVSVVITPNASPGPPSVAPMVVMLTPGGPATMVNASFAATGCAAQGFAWNLGAGADAGLTLSVNGGQLTLVPPLAYCSAVPGQFDVSVQATSATSTSVSTTVPVTLNPWGPPLAPQFAQPSYEQDAGTDRDYATAPPEHLCLAAPVGVAWEFDGGATGATLTSMSNLSARVRAPDCVNGTAELAATRFISTNMASRSSRVSVAINIGTHLEPIGADAGLMVTSEAVPGEGAKGTVSYSGFRCEKLRQAQARIRLFAAGGGGPDVAWGDFDGGDWSLRISGGCNGGTYDGLAQLLENNVATGTEVPVPRITLPSVQAAVGRLTQDRLNVTCEAGLNAVIDLEQAPGACTATETTWWLATGQDAGLLTQNPLRGSAATVQSQLGLGLEELVGRDLVWDVSVDAGSGNIATAQRSVHLVTAPFVTITHQAEHTRVSEGDVLGVQATLVNGTECTVSSLMLQESLASLSYLEGTARVDGRSVPASTAKGILTIGPVELGGRATAKVTWLGRVPLSPKVVFSAIAMLHGENVSVDLTTQPIKPHGCGCGSSDGGMSVLTLLAVLALSRRQRKPSAASS
jgi:MYXO-CTERM domain-containing protein